MNATSEFPRSFEVLSKFDEVFEVRVDYDQKPRVWDSNGSKSSSEVGKNLNKDSRKVVENKDTNIKPRHIEAEHNSLGSSSTPKQEKLAPLNNKNFSQAVFGAKQEKLISTKSKSSKQADSGGKFHGIKINVLILKMFHWSHPQLLTVLRYSPHVD